MKIKDIIKESKKWDDLDPYGEISPEERAEMDPYGENDAEDEDDFEMDIPSNADAKMINAVRKVCEMFKGQGHAQVELLPFLTKVIEIAKKPVNLADLIAINKKSLAIQSMIDSIDEKKVKFKNMSVKNDDPEKKEQEKSSTVSAMAGRASARDRGLR